MTFYHRSQTPKVERKGMAFIDRGKALDIRIILDQNIQAALHFAFLKWGSVKIIGSPAFVARTEACLKNLPNA